MITAEIESLEINDFIDYSIVQDCNIVSVKALAYIKKLEYLQSVKY